MGGFYGSIHLRTNDRDAVRDILEPIAREKKYCFLLSPALRTWVGVYPDKGQDERAIGRLALVKRFVKL